MHVTVVLPLYQPNRRFLGEQLDSIDAQTYEDMDILVYNDCPDDSDIELRRFCRSRCFIHRLRYVPSEENLGYVKAFEKLVNLAGGGHRFLRSRRSLEKESY